MITLLKELDLQNEEVQELLNTLEAEGCDEEEITFANFKMQNGRKWFKGIDLTRTYTHNGTTYEADWEQRDFYNGRIEDGCMLEECVALRVIG